MVTPYNDRVPTINTIKSMLAVGCITFFSSTATRAEIHPPTITLAAGESTATALPQMNAQFRDAFQRIGRSLILIKGPNQRVLHEAAIGNIDGVVFRHPLAVKGVPSLTPIPIPVHTLHYWVYMPSSSNCGALEDLPQRQPVGVLGLKYSDLVYERSHAGHQQATTVSRALEMVLAGRADYFVAPPIVHQWMTKQTGKALKRCFEKPLFSLMGYTYLNEKHRALIPKLTDVYRQVFTPLHRTRSQSIAHKNQRNPAPAP